MPAGGEERFADGAVWTFHSEGPTARLKNFRNSSTGCREEEKTFVYARNYPFRKPASGWSRNHLQGGAGGMTRPVAA